MEKKVFNDTDIMAGGTLRPDTVGENNGELQFRKPKKTRRRRIIFIAAAAVLAAAIIGGSVFLVYRLFFYREKYDDSAAFYFASDLLSEEGGNFIAYDTIDFNIYNYADSLRISREAVEDFDITVKANGKNITSQTEITTGETAMEADVRSSCSVSISVPEKYNDAEIEVIAVSSPINKEISGTFTIKPKWGYTINDKKGNACAELVIYANSDVNIALTWDGDDVIPDNNNSYVRTAVQGEETCYVTLGAGMSTMIPLFKTDTGEDYTDDDKVVTLEETDYKVDIADTAKTDSSEREGE